MARVKNASRRANLDYPQRIKSLRAKLGLTQQALAERLEVSFATVNRWENGQTIPSQLSWKQIRQLEISYSDADDLSREEDSQKSSKIDFTARPDIVKLLAEGERLSYGHLINPTFATEISRIEPLPHQRIAVYEHMLNQQFRLRFLLADDAGAGKTIMSGLYIREMLSRRLLHRILIVVPAGLVGNWQRELFTLFNLPFYTVSGNDLRYGNPFVGEQSDRVIVSIDTLTSPRVFERLRHPDVLPYDLAIFDEAHKLSADCGKDLRVRKTDRYCLAEALAGIVTHDEKWLLNWSAQHILLLTATPHMGKDYPYYALWRLLEPEILTTREAFSEYPFEQRSVHFIRRTKEEMVNMDGSPLYPDRISNTFSYTLTQGALSEQTLYDETTDYLRFVYNKAKLLNREAARLAMSVFQRRLASSTFALLRSLERRMEKLDMLIEDLQSGRLSDEQLFAGQQRISDADDVLANKTADDENPGEGYEENELSERKLLQGVIATNLTDLLAERDEVQRILDVAKKVYESGHESKFERLREIITDREYANEKIIIFTEHRDTMEFIVRRLGGLGYTGQIAQIHGGMSAQTDPSTGFSERDQQVEIFRKPVSEGGARFLVCTDAAGEGINLQFCWIMVNYDIPWNPARLEQRMGRIHRYGQKHDPVVILNLVAALTREGKVLKVLLEKLEKIRNELQSDKVFDCIGRIFQDVSIKQYMELAVTGEADDVARQLDGRLTKEQVQSLVAREKSLYGSGGDVAKELPRLRMSHEKEIYLRLIPGYVRQYIQQAAPLLDIEIEGDMAATFTFRPVRMGAMDPLLSALELYPQGTRDRFSITRQEDAKNTIWLHPGEPVFERFRDLMRSRLSDEGRRGAVFVDSAAEKPYLFHLALLSVIRKAEPEIPELSNDETLDCRLIGVKQSEGAEISICPVEHLLLLKEGSGIPAEAQRLAAIAEKEKESAYSFLAERVAREISLDYKNRLLEVLPERENLVQRGFAYQEASLATARAKHTEKARKGNRKAIEAIEQVKRQQRELAGYLKKTMKRLRSEPELVATGTISFISHALVVPSIEPIDLQQQDANVELIAMKIAQAFEEACGAEVFDVHTPELARKIGLTENPGFDLLSIREEKEKRAIEVKGRALTVDIEVSANEWAKACNMRDRYWLYVVYDCATSNPRLVRVQDPFGSLLAKEKGSVLISRAQIDGVGEI